jgi:histidinol-phosphate aminotransferase
MSRAAPLWCLRDDVRALQAYPVATSEGLVKLDAMENPYALPPEMARRLGEHLGQVALNRYPPGDLSSFRRRLGGRAGLPDDSALLLGNGSDELIHLIIQACARPGAVILSPWPSFSMYRMSAILDGCRFADVPLAPDFSLDLPAMLAAIALHKPAVVFLAYPNNPTGNLFDRSAIETILETAPGLVVIDEAYLPFAQRTWIDELPARPALLVLRTLSKLGLAGLRLGYLCGAPELIEQLDKVRPPYNVNVLTLAAVDFLLDHFGVLDNQAATLRADRDRLLAELRTIAGVQVFPSAANFILLRVANASDVFAKLLQRGILTKNVAGMHPLLDNCLRVTIGTAEENALFALALRASISV